MKFVLKLTVIVFLLSASCTFANLPYPIIFVHGLTSDHVTWETSIGEIQRFAGLSEPYVYHVCLNDDGSDQTSLVGEDVSPIGWTTYSDLEDDDNDEERDIIHRNDVPSQTRLFAINFKEEQFQQIHRVGNEHDNHPHSNAAAIYKQGFALGLLIKEVLEITEKEKVILVGHSMGGLAIREYLQRTNNNEHL